MSSRSFKKLVRKVFVATKKTDSIFAELTILREGINAKYEPRAEFNRWRDSSDGQLWKALKYKKQKGCCAICKKSIELKGSHIDHIRPISIYPGLALDIQNMQVACPICNASKGNKFSNPVS